MKYNIIGDIHGRTHWERLIKETCPNIFVGDYFDPYDNIPYEKLKENFLNIIMFAKTHTETILLLGNHDLHYLHHEFGTSRKIEQHEKEIERLFLDNMHLFYGMAYDIGDKVLVSHAGCTKEWLADTDFTGDYNPLEIAEHINNVFWDGYTVRSDGTSGWGEEPWSTGLSKFMFSFGASKYWGDVYGTSPDQSPAWIRPQTLISPSHNALPEGIQIVGHTQAKKLIPTAHPHIIIVDVLGSQAASLIVQYNNGEYKFDVNEI